MPKLSINITHNLGEKEALERIKKFLPELKEKHADKISDLEENWSGNTGTFKLKISGFKVSGSLNITGSDVLINGDIPFLAVPFKSQIESVIRDQAEIILKKK